MGLGTVIRACAALVAIGVATVALLVVILNQPPQLGVNAREIPVTMQRLHSPCCGDWVIETEEFPTSILYVNSDFVAYFDVTQMQRDVARGDTIWLTINERRFGADDVPSNGQVLGVRSATTTYFATARVIPVMTQVELIARATLAFALACFAVASWPLVGWLWQHGRRLRSHQPARAA